MTPGTQMEADRGFLKEHRVEKKKKKIKKKNTKNDNK
jgi:hypothetical protein